MTYRNILVATILLFFISGPVSGVIDEGCPGGGGEDLSYNSNRTMYLDEVSSWSGKRYLNDTLFVNATLNIVNATLLIGGDGLIVAETGRMNIINSTLRPLDQSGTFYLETRGELTIIDSDVSGCLDKENSYFGIYVSSGGFLEGDGLDMTRSGMIRVDNSSISLERSGIPGIVSLSGEVIIEECSVLSHGLSQIGDGEMEVTKTTLTSNVSFSIGVSAISVLQGGSLRVDDVNINGTYNVGVFASYSDADIEDVSISLPDGIYGIKADNSTIGTVRNISTTLVSGGVAVIGSERGTEFVDCDLGSRDFGALTEGINGVTFGSCRFGGSSVGIISESSLTVSDSLFSDNRIGIRMGANQHLEISGNRFVDYDMFAVEQETWNEVTYPDNEYDTEDPEAVEIVWWGEIGLVVSGPKGMDVKGAKVEVSSFMTQYTGQNTGYVGTVWGYNDGRENVTDVETELVVSWGGAEVERTFTPSKGDVLDVELPMADLWIRDLKYSEGKIIVSLVLNGTDADNVRLSLEIDGDRMRRYVNLSAGEEVNVSFPAELEEGIYRAEAGVSSPDEYTGSGGILLENNALDKDISVKEEASSVTTVIWLTVTIVILVLLVPLFFIDKTKS